MLCEDRNLYQPCVIPSLFTGAPCPRLQHLHRILFQIWEYQRVGNRGEKRSPFQPNGGPSESVYCADVSPDGSLCPFPRAGHVAVWRTRLLSCRKGHTQRELLRVASSPTAQFSVADSLSQAVTEGKDCLASLPPAYPSLGQSLAPKTARLHAPRPARRSSITTYRQNRPSPGIRLSNRASHHARPLLSVPLPSTRRAIDSN